MFTVHQANGAATDQASRLRALVRRRQSPSLMVAVTSGKGGVGKSNVAANVSVLLSSRGMRVVLVDLDLGVADADVLLNLKPRYTLAHVLAGRCGLEEVLVEGPCGLRVAAGASGVRQAADLSEFERQHLLVQIEKLRANTDIVVMDCGAGIGRNVIGFAKASDRIIVVTTPQPTALADAYAMIKALHAEGSRGDVSLLVNMVGRQAEAVAAYQRIARVAQKFLNYSVAHGGYVLQDNAVESAVRERCPFVTRYPNSNASACIAALASELARSLVGRKTESDRGSLLRRVAGLFV